MCVSSHMQKKGGEFGNGAMGEINSIEKQKVELIALLAGTVGRKAEFIHGKQFGYSDHVVA